MQIAKVESGVVTQTGDYRELFPNTSFPANGPSDDWLAVNNCLRVSLFLPYDPNLEKLVPCAPYIVGRWVYTMQAVPLAPEDLAAHRASLAAQVRAERNVRIAACDWTQLDDAPVDKAAWAVYRQALRDVPSQAGFPEAVSWPAAPGTSSAVPVGTVTSNVSVSGG